MQVLFGLATFSCSKCGTILCDEKRMGCVFRKSEFFAMLGSEGMCWVKMCCALVGNMGQVSALRKKAKNNVARFWRPSSNWPKKPESVFHL